VKHSDKQTTFCAVFLSKINHEMSVLVAIS